MKYFGVATPFHGVHMYTGGLMCCVLGDLLQDSFITKIADDQYCRGNSSEQLLHSWSRVLHVLQQNNVCLSASKNVIIMPQVNDHLGMDPVTRLAQCNFPLHLCSCIVSHPREWNNLLAHTKSSHMLSQANLQYWPPLMMQVQVVPQLTASNRMMNYTMPSTRCKRRSQLATP